MKLKLTTSPVPPQVVEEAERLNKAAHATVEFTATDTPDSRRAWERIAAAVDARLWTPDQAAEYMGVPVWVPSYDNGNVIDAVKVVDRTHEQSPEPKRIEHDD